MPIENFFAYTILRAALFSAASPAERLRSAGSLAKIQTQKEHNKEMVIVHYIKFNEVGEILWLFGQL